MEKLNKPPQLWIIAGPNGSGKSTLTERFGLSRRLPIVNPDEIAKALPDHSPIKAGKIAIGEQERLLSMGESFALETTLSGKREMDFLRRSKEAGYKVTLVYVGLGSPGANRTRVAQRVVKGGHNVPDEDVIRRYKRSMENLEQAVKYSDRTYVLDNSSKKSLRLIFNQDREQVKYISKDVPKWVNASLGSYLKEVANRQIAPRFGENAEKITPEYTCDVIRPSRAAAFEQLPEAIKIHPDLAEAYKNEWTQKLNQAELSLETEKLSPQKITYTVSTVYNHQAVDFVDAKEAAKAFHAIDAKDIPSVVRVVDEKKAQSIAATTSQRSPGQETEYLKYIGNADQKFDAVYKNLVVNDLQKKYLKRLKR